MTLVYKVASEEEWRAAERAGIFEGATIDRRDGYIHLSAAAQVETTVALHFTTRDDLVLAALDAEAFGDALKWEPSRGGELFPHLYAPLPLGRVAWARRFSARDAGQLRSLIAGGG